MVKKANKTSAYRSAAYRPAPARRQRAKAPAVRERKSSRLTAKRRPESAAAATALVRLPQLGQLAQTEEAKETAPALPKVASGARRWLWLHRWDLTPLVATSSAVVGAAVDPTLTMAAAGALAGAGHLAVTKLPTQIVGRVWLSLRERAIARSWGIGTAAWAASVGAGWVDVSLGGLALLAAATGVQTRDWLVSRRTRAADEPASPLVAELVRAWPVTIGKDGPDALKGSRIVASTVTEPAPGAMSFSVELRGDVHAEDAVSDTIRKHLERVLRMGVGTAALRIDRNDAARVTVTLTPTRHLERAAAPWDGPILNADGSIPLAVEGSGAGIDVGLFNESGVEHAAIFGTTGGGKSNTLVTMLLPGACEGIETVWYIDGGLGSSAGHLAGACDWWGVSGPTEWEAMIRAAHAVMRARKARRAKRGLSSWRGRDEKDPILTLVIDEATTVVDQLGKGIAKLIAELLREGRKLGVRVIQCTQDPLGDGLIGGRNARDLMAGGGSLIAHRPGGAVAASLSATSTSEKIDLRALPPEAGWCGIIRRGTVATHAARVRYASEEAVLAVLHDVTPRALDGEDLVAAGGAYRVRVTGRAAAAAMLDEDATDTAPGVDDDQAVSVTAEDAEIPGQTAIDDEQDDEDAEIPEGLEGPLAGSQLAARRMRAVNRTNVLGALKNAPGGLTRAQLRDRTRLSVSTVRRCLSELADEGRITQNPDDRTWHLAVDEQAA